jgi:hypothetical protein
MDAMRSIRANMGELFHEQGIVRPDQYEESLDTLSQIKDQVIEKFSTGDEERKVWEKLWPFGT